MAKLPIKGTIPHGRTTSSEDLPLKVTDSGGLGVLNVTGGGGGTEYAEDTAHVSGDLGTQVLAVRNDAGTALAGTTGDYIPLSTDNTGALRVTGGGGGTQYTEADTDASITGTAIMWEDALDTLRAVSTAKPLPVHEASTAQVDLVNVGGASFSLGQNVMSDSLPVAIASNQTAVPISASSLPLPTGASTEATLSAINAKLVSGNDIGDVDVTSVIAGTGATNLGKAEDAAHSTGDTGVMMLAVRQDTAAALAGTSGDYIPLTTDSTGFLRTVSVLSASSGKEVPKLEDAAGGDGDSGIPAMAVRKATPANTSGTDGDYEFLQMSAGRLWTSATIDAALPAGTNAIGKLSANSGVDIGDVDVASVIAGTGATNLGKAEDAAHSSSDTGVFALGVRNDTLATTFAGTTGDYSGIATDSLGAVWVRNVAYNDSGTTLTAINTTYNNVTTTASSADITIPTGSRMCDLIMTIDSTLAPTDITFHIEAKDGSTYFRMKNGFLGKFIFDDTAVATAQNIHVTFPCPMTGTMRVTAVATGTDATNYFVVSNAKLFFRS